MQCGLISYHVPQLLSDGYTISDVIRSYERVLALAGIDSRHVTLCE